MCPINKKGLLVGLRVADLAWLGKTNLVTEESLALVQMGYEAARLRTMMGGAAIMSRQSRKD
jgi:hypothetical protein